MHLVDVSYRLITEKIMKKYLEVSNDFDGLIKINQRLDELCLNEGEICWSLQFDIKTNRNTILAH